LSLQILPGGSTVW